MRHWRNDAILEASPSLFQVQAYESLGWLHCSGFVLVSVMLVEEIGIMSTNRKRKKLAKQNEDRKRKKKLRNWH